MATEDEVTVKVEEPVYVAEAEPVDDGADAQPVEGEGGAGAAVDALKNGGNPLDAMDGYTLLVGLLVTSIIVFVAASVTLWGTGTAIVVAGSAVGLSYWAFVGSLLSIIGCVIMIVFKKCCEPQFVAAGPVMMIIFLVLWLAIVLPCTFSAPFITLSNGWLGSWASLVLAAALAGRAFADKAKAMQNAINSQTSQGDAVKFALFLGVASIVVLIAVCVNFGGSGYEGYAVAVAVISILAVVVVLIIANVASMKQHSNKTNMIISIFLIVWWAIGAFIMTFVSPFQSGTPLNGYLGVWICVYAAFSLFKACGLATVTQMFNKMKGGGNADGGNAESSAEDTPAL